jgi:hypothetical protein
MLADKTARRTSQEKFSEFSLDRLIQQRGFIFSFAEMSSEKQYFVLAIVHSFSCCFSGFASPEAS